MQFKKIWETFVRKWIKLTLWLTFNFLSQFDHLLNRNLTNLLLGEYEYATS